MTVRFESAEGRDLLDACIALRIAVFVDEQDVPIEEEVDAHDHTDALHVAALDDDTVVGTARIVPVDGKAKIGRVAVARSHRGTGLGAALMRATMDRARTRGVSSMVLDAQTQAIGFYERLGFTAEGPEFDDAGIPHRRMVLVVEGA